MSSDSQPPYWLAGGTEICAICHQPYVIETEHRCAGCDDALCAHCAQREHAATESFCSPCHQESAKRGSAPTRGARRQVRRRR